MDKRENSIDRTWDILDTWEDQSPPRRLKRSIMKSIRPEKRFHIPLFHLSPAYALAALVVLVVVGTLYLKSDTFKEFWPSSHDTRTAQQEESVEIPSTDIIANFDLIVNIEMLEVLDTLEDIDNIPPPPDNGQSSRLAASRRV